MVDVESTFLPVNEALLFQGLRWRLLRNSWRRMLGQSSMRPLVILLCSGIVWVFVFAISWSGFRFLEVEVRVPLSGGIVGILLDLLFLSLAVLLLFSSGLILYASLFSSAETAFLLSRPVSADQVFAYKFQGAIAFSSWAFLLLGGPILIAYGLACAASWYFYALLPLFFLGFVLLPGSLGGLAALLIVNYIPRRRKQILALCLVVPVALIVLWIYGMVRTSPGHLWHHEMREAVTRLLGYFTFTRSPFVPSHWISLGLQRAVRGEAADSLYYLALVWSNGLLWYLIVAATSARLYRRGYNRLSTGGESLVKVRRATAVRREAWIDRLLYVCLPFVPANMRLLIVKDFRTFRRDPQQWGQIVAFSVLMMLYFGNIHRFAEYLKGSYQSGVSYLNLCAIALLLCTYTGRFVYPMLSLEGSKFWILGLLPMRREQLLWGKFAFATTGGVLISEFLVLISDLILKMPFAVIVLHTLIVIVLSAGLSGLSVGLGACMADFHETDPSKIAAGFGGTLNLVAGLLFLLFVLITMAAPWHGRAMFSDESELHISNDFFRIGGLSLIAVGLFAGLAAGAACIVLPLRAGIRALREMEF